MCGEARGSVEHSAIRVVIISYWYAMYAATTDLPRNREMFRYHRTSTGQLLDATGHTSFPVRMICLQICLFTPCRRTIDIPVRQLAGGQAHKLQSRASRPGPRVVRCESAEHRPRKRQCQRELSWIFYLFLAISADVQWRIEPSGVTHEVCVDCLTSGAERAASGDSFSEEKAGWLRRRSGR